MNRALTVALLATIALPMPVLAQASSFLPEATADAPPSKPIPLTLNQYDALRSLQQLPQHQHIQDVPATFISEEAKLEADVTHYGFLAGLPTALLIVLIAAAPL